MTMQRYQWIAEFNDGYTFHQYNEDGTENLVKQFIPDKFKIALTTDPEFNLFGRNFFEDIEAEHGRCVKFSWIPFTDIQKSLIERHQPDNEVFVESKRFGIFPPRKFTQMIPKDCYVTWSRQSTAGIVPKTKKGHIMANENYLFRIILINRISGEKDIKIFELPLIGYPIPQ